MTNKVHFLTLEHRKLIEEGVNNKTSIYMIGKMVGFSDKAIHKELERNSVDGVYNAEIAQKMAEERRILHLAQARTEIRKYNSLWDRIDALEEIVKTLSQLIEEIYDKVNN